MSIFSADCYLYDKQRISLYLIYADRRESEGLEGRISLRIALATSLFPKRGFAVEEKRRTYWEGTQSWRIQTIRVSQNRSNVWAGNQTVSVDLGKHPFLLRCKIELKDRNPIGIRCWATVNWKMSIAIFWELQGIGSFFIWPTGLTLLSSFSKEESFFST